MLLDIRDVSLGYNSKVIFSGLSLSVDSGDLVLISGPSGSGKSSLLRLLNRLNDPTDGNILFNGHPITDCKVVELRRQICYIQQTPMMIEGTVGQNLLLPFSFRSLRDAPPPADATLLGLLQQFRLADISLSDNASTLSVGQKQRLAFMRALLLKPKILLLDEPTSALDSESRTIVEEQIEELVVKQEMAVIMITHLDFKPRQIKVRRYLLGQGSLREQKE